MLCFDGCNKSMFNKLNDRNALELQQNISSILEQQNTEQKKTGRKSCNKR